MTPTKEDIEIALNKVQNSALEFSDTTMNDDCVILFALRFTKIALGEPSQEACNAVNTDPRSHMKSAIYFKAMIAQMEKEAGDA